ncbi:argininosuccinate synthase domain-containing protein [Rhizobium mongolense]|uniref:argininosuccinate synthase domain-containing protein n=1 Tax=Rhizobium mongolense TaxID=57676 RepID=UPI003557D0B3
MKPAIRAHAKYLGNYPLSSSLSRPVIASLVVGHATSIGSRLLLHTANLSQNSLPRLNNSIKRSGFSDSFGSPYERSVIPDSRRPPPRKWSGDENLWCRKFKSGPLDAPEEAFDWTRNIAAEQPAEVKLGLSDYQVSGSCEPAS